MNQPHLTYTMQTAAYPFRWLCALSFLLFPLLLNAQPVYLELGLINQGNRQRVEIGLEVDRSLSVHPLEGVLLVWKQRLAFQGGGVLEQDTIDLYRAPLLDRVNQTWYYNVPLTYGPGDSIRFEAQLIDRISGEQLSREAVFHRVQSPIPYHFENLSRPEQQSYLTAGDSAIVRGEQERSLFLVRFRHDFETAAPPMTTETLVQSKELRVDSVLLIQANQPFKLSVPGLYLVQEDTTTGLGVGFRVEPADYPKYRKLSHLLGAMTYITTAKEYSTLAEAADKKPGFDNFWINTGGTISNGQRLIRLYFQRVAHANKNFTTYKEGWKTDKGIIYIIFGRPDRITRRGQTEQWFFEPKEGVPVPVVFRFVRRNNIFSGNHYELERGPGYRDLWYGMVRKWRKGEI